MEMQIEIRLPTASELRTEEKSGGGFVALIPDVRFLAIQPHEFIS
jgi:hypothetical protein